MAQGLDRKLSRLEAALEGGEDNDTVRAIYREFRRYHPGAAREALARIQDQRPAAAAGLAEED